MGVRQTRGDSLNQFDLRHITRSSGFIYSLHGALLVMLKNRRKAGIEKSHISKTTCSLTLL